MGPALTIPAALVGGLLLEYFRVPAGALVGAMAGVGVVNLVGQDVLSVPGPVRFLALATIGWLIGQDLTRSAIAAMVTHSKTIALIVVSLVLFGGLLAYVAVKALHLSPATAFLAASPGGLSQMSALSAAAGADGVVVATTHLFRVLIVVVVAPSVMRLFGSN